MERSNGYQGVEESIYPGDFDPEVVKFILDVGHANDEGSPRLSLHAVVSGLVKGIVIGADGDDRGLLFDKCQGTVLQFTGGQSLGMYVGDFLKLQGCFGGYGEVNSPGYEVEIAAIIDNLKSLIDIHLSSSVFYKRFFLRITERYPEAIKALKSPELLREFGDGIYSDVQSMRTPKEKKEKLGDYYDFEMMRVGLRTLSGAAADEINIEYTEFSDRYILTLFDICRQEIDTQNFISHSS